MPTDDASAGQTPWPPVGWEERAWVSRAAAGRVSASARRRHSGPYRAAVAPLIAELPLRLPTRVLAEAEEASVEIARFDAELGPDAAMFAPVLLRLEAMSSSRIEHVTASAKAVALAELGSRGNPDATEIVGNVSAMGVALELADPLDGDAILAVHAALMSGHADEIAGRWRQQQVWIGGDSLGPHDAMFVPPHHDRVPDLINDLIAFTRRTDLPVLPQAAIAHAQFQTIHPFPDGNGRTGRALVHAMLRSRELTRNVTVPVSAGLLSDIGTYFDALTAYREGNPAAIVSRLANSTLGGIATGRVLAKELRTIRAAWEDRVKARRGAAAWRLADLLMRQPVVDAATVARELGLAQQNAQRALTPLVDAGVLEEFTGFRRNRMWHAREVLHALDAFAARAVRRGYAE